MKKILFLIFLFFIVISFASAQMCEFDEECTGVYCTDFSHKTYSSAICNNGICDGTGRYSCIIGSCDAECAIDSDCGCPEDYCDGFDLIDYPDNGRCGTAGSEGCLCQVDIQTGGDCMPTIVENHPTCLAELCEATETTRDCYSDGYAEVGYEWNYPECGIPYSWIEEDSDCLCDYNPWEEGDCVADGYREYTRDELSGNNYCTEPLSEQRQDLDCDCESSFLEEQCISDGYSQLTYTYNYDYCPDDYTVDEPKETCSCVYSDWEDNDCIEDGIMDQSRYQLTSFNYCLGPFEQSVEDESCDCESYSSYSECVSDGYAEVGYEWNYDYCPDDFTQTEQNQDCDCDYTEWQNDECYTDGIREQTRDELTGFYYCTADLVRDFQDSECDCLAEETSRMCLEEGSAEVFYTYNYDYCEGNFSQIESDTNCNCRYGSWVYTGCAYDGFSYQERYETSDYDYCEDTLYREVPLLSCSCRTSEVNRECSSDGNAEVYYERNYDYCGQDYSEIKLDQSCSCIYEGWQNLECVSDGLIHQSNLETTDFDYCQDIKYRDFSDSYCDCESYEYYSECVSDGYSQTYYDWNYDYCGSSFTNLIEKELCDCIYTAWQDQDCVAYNSMMQIRQELSNYDYCTEPLSRTIEHPACDYIESDSINFGISIGNTCPEIVPESEVYFVHSWTDEVPSDSRLLSATLGVEDLLDIAQVAGWAGRSYAFDGELITFEFDAVDQDGEIDDCSQGFITLDCGIDPKVVQCVKTVEVVDENLPTEHEVAHFSCEYIVEDAETANGECWVSFKIEDTCSDCEDTLPGALSLYLNPAVGITYTPQQSSDGFGFKYNVEGDVLMRIVNGEVLTGPMPGDTAYTPYFAVENAADPETGLYILLQMYGTDFRATNTEEFPPLCGTSDRLEIENMDYMARHENAQQNWTQIPDGTNYGPLEADYVFTNWVGPDFNGAANFLGVGDDITMRLRLHIPQPCQGDFSLGGDVMFVGTVI